jgi:hypothetical protein
VSLSRVAEPPHAEPPHALIAQYCRAEFAGHGGTWLGSFGLEAEDDYTWAVAPTLDETVTDMLESETFEPDELVAVLVGKGHARDRVVAAVERARQELELRDASPAAIRAREASRLGSRVIRAGIFTLVVGLGFTVFTGGGVVQMWLVFAGGAAIVAAGYRTLRAGR